MDRLSLRRDVSSFSRVETHAPGLLRAVTWVQATYYVLTGLWPLVSMRTFLRVTGPKTDLWLVTTVGCLVGVIGLTLGVAAARRAISGELVALGAGSAAVFAGVDVLFVSRGMISHVYLLDAMLEILLLCGWGLAYKLRRSHGVGLGAQA